MLPPHAPHAKGTMPTHEVALKEKDSERRGIVGVGWEDEDGSVSFSLNPGVVLSWKDNVNLRLRRISPERQRARAERVAMRSTHGENASEVPEMGARLHFLCSGSAACGAVKEEGKVFDATTSPALFYNRTKFQRCLACETWAKTNLHQRKIHLAADRPDRPWACDTSHVALENTTSNTNAVTCKICLHLLRTANMVRDEPDAEPRSLQDSEALRDEAPSDEASRDEAPRDDAVRDEAPNDGADHVV